MRRASPPVRIARIPNTAAGTCRNPPATRRQPSSDQSLVGQTLVIEGHPFTVAGVAPPGFFGDTLRDNPPELWIPLQHEPMITGANSLLRQPVSAWLRVIGRLTPGATTHGIAPRLTNVLRQWIPHDSGWPANWLSDLDTG